MHKWERFCAGVLLVWGVLFCTCACAETRLMVVSDLHYLSPSLYEGNPLLETALLDGDGKVTHLSAPLLAALQAEALHQQSDALLLTGDLTLNGEQASHEELAAALAALEGAGIPVLVLPGNHDINGDYAYDYTGNAPRSIHSIRPAAFAGLYAPFGREEARWQDSTTLSYVADLGGGWYVAALDLCVYAESSESFGLFTTDTLAWLDAALTEVEALGGRVLCATHQSLTAHNSAVSAGYGIWGDAALQECLEKHGVRLNLSGHIHLQHIANAGGVTDAALSAMSLSPHHYALVTLADDGGITYDTRELCAEHLPQGFQAETKAFFDAVSARKVLAALTLSPADEEAQSLMLPYAVALNYAYFSGTASLERDRFLADAAYALWRDQGGTGRFGKYLLSVLEEAPRDMLRFTLPAQ